MNQPTQAHHSSKGRPMQCGAVAAHRAAHSRSAGIPDRRRLSLWKSCAGHRIQSRSHGALRWCLPGLGSARGCLRHRQEEPRTRRHRPLRLHAQPALSRIDADRCRICARAAQLAGRAAARRRICGNLHSGHCVGGAIPARHISRVRELLPQRAEIYSAPDRCQNSTPNRAKPLFPQPVTSMRLRMGFSFGLYLKHREYNSALGAALLYLSLLFLRPCWRLFCIGPGKRFPRQRRSTGKSKI